jgi:hypothetical protein
MSSMPTIHKKQFHKRVSRMAEIMQNQKPAPAQSELDELNALCPPGYSVRWNPEVRCWPDDPYGMVEVVDTDQTVHYRRTSVKAARILLQP